MRAAYAAQTVSDRPLLQPLASAIRRAPVTCPPAVPLQAALERMHAQQVGAIVVVDAEGAPEASLPSATSSAMRRPAKSRSSGRSART